MKITIKLDKRTCKKNGEFPIKFMVSKSKSTFYILTGFATQSRYWNENTGLLRANAVNAEEVNNYLQDRLARYQKVLRDLSDDLTDDEVREALLASEKAPVSHRLPDVWREFVGNKNGKTKATYDYAWKWITEYSPRLDWDQFNYAWLLAFQKFLTDSSLGIDTRGIILRCLRAVNNYALRCEYTNAYPFRSFQIATAPSAARRKNELTLTVAEIKSLWSAPLEGSLAWVRDVWFVSFFLGGINLIDLYNLSSADKELKIRYVRAKIKRFQPEEVELDLSGFPTILLDWFQDKSSNCFAIDRCGREWDRFSDYTKKALQRLSAAVGFKVNMYAARYSWATLAASSGVAVDVIDRVQGHVGSGTLAEKYYIRFDWSRVRDALGVVAGLVVE